MIIFPNPIQERTSITVVVPENMEETRYSIMLSNSKGEQLTTVIGNQIWRSGNNIIFFDTKKYAKGTYFISLVKDNKILITKKVVK